MNNSIVLLSGGLDSVVSLAIIKESCDNILALTFNYGQKSFEAEKNSSIKIAQYYNIDHKIVNLPWLSEISDSSLNKDNELPIISYEDLDNINIAKETAHSVWVPNRNGLFVNIAACYCDSLKFEYIVIGANKEEGASFKDNTIDFINAVNKSFSYSVYNKVKLIAPLIDKTKTEIVKEGIRLNAPLELIHSCYNNGVRHCSNCESCKRLKRALKANNSNDIIDKIF